MATVVARSLVPARSAPSVRTCSSASMMSCSRILQRSTSLHSSRKPCTLRPFCTCWRKRFQLLRVDRAAVCEAISPAALPPTPSKTAAKPLCSSVRMLSSLRSGCLSQATECRAKVKGVNSEAPPPIEIRLSRLIFCCDILVECSLRNPLPHALVFELM